MAKKKEDNSDLYIYYNLEKTNDDVDVRYIRENGLQIGDFDPKNNFFTFYELKEHPLNDKLGDFFSVFKTIYKISPDILSKLKNLEFPSIKKFRREENSIGYIIKYNPTEKIYFSPLSNSSVIRLYEYKNYKYNNYSTNDLSCVILRNKKLFKSID